MSNIVNLTLVKSTPSTNGGFILKLQSKKTGSVQTPFGMKEQNSQLTYYMKVASVALQVGAAADLDVSLFTVVPRDMEIEETAQELINGVMTSVKHKKTIQCKWLQLK